MADAAREIPVYRFVQELFDDLTLTLPSLGCRFSGSVPANALTVVARAVVLKNQLFLLFADLAAGRPELTVAFKLATAGPELILEFLCSPFDAARVESLANWQPTYRVLQSAEGEGFATALPQGAPLEVGPPLRWDQLAQLYGGVAEGRKVLDAFLERAPALLAALGAAVAAGDAAEVLRLAHTLKGSARGVTAGIVAEASLQLEMAGRSGTLARAADLYKALEVTYDGLIQWVREGQR